MSSLSGVESKATINRRPESGALVDAAEIFGLLSDPGRLRMLTALRFEQESVGRLAEIAGLSESGASHALRLLRAHRIVRARRDGRMVYYELADEHVRQLLEIALQHAQHSSVDYPVVTQ